MSNHGSSKSTVLTFRLENEQVELFKACIEEKKRSSFIKRALLDALNVLQNQSEQKTAGASNGIDAPAVF